MPYRHGLWLTITLHGALQKSFFLFIVNNKLQITEQELGDELVIDAVLDFFELSEKVSSNINHYDNSSVHVSVDKSTFVEYCLVNPVLAPLSAKYAFGYPYNDKNDEKVLLVFEIYKNVFNAMHELNQELYA